MEGFTVIFDRVNSRVGFAASKCASKLNDDTITLSFLLVDLLPSFKKDNNMYDLLYFTLLSNSYSTKLSN